MEDYVSEYHSRTLLLSFIDTLFIIIFHDEKVDEIITELTNNSDIIASHLVTEADCALCHALVAKARAAAVASASIGEEAPSDPEEEHRNCSAPGVCAAENLSLRKQMHVRTHV